MPTIEFLEDFGEAFNRHDVDAIVAHMTDDCEFYLSNGPDVHGFRYSGRDRVRQGVQYVFDQYPDGRWEEARHFVAGDRGVSEWVFRGTQADGTRVESRGCDVLTFRDGRIAVKDSYRKGKAF